MFETMVVELEELLGRLTKINDKMMDYTHNLGMLQIVIKCRRNKYMGLGTLIVLFPICIWSPHTGWKSHNQTFGGLTPSCELSLFNDLYTVHKIRSSGKLVWYSSTSLF